MKNVKIDISYFIDDGRFVMSVEILNLEEGAIEFTFSNNTGALARNCIQIFENGELLEPVEILYISPVNPYRDLIKLESGQSQEFELPARIEMIDGFVCLAFKGITYKIIPDKEYSLSLKYLGVNSNTILFNHHSFTH